MSTAAYDIEHHPEEGEGWFKLMVDQEEAGGLYYTLASQQRLAIQHTEVAPALRGSKAAPNLVDAVCDWARQENLRIVPVCPFAKKLMNARPDRYGDVLA